MILKKGRNGKPVWAQENGSNFLFRGFDNFWQISSEDDPIVACYHPSISDDVPVCGWFRRSGHTWLEDCTLTVAHDRVSSMWVLDFSQYEFAGIYTCTSNTFVNAQPVWWSDEKILTSTFHGFRCTSSSKPFLYTGGHNLFPSEWNLSRDNSKVTCTATDISNHHQEYLVYSSGSAGSKRSCVMGRYSIQFSRDYPPFQWVNANPNYFFKLRDYRWGIFYEYSRLVEQKELSEDILATGWMWSKDGVLDESLTVLGLSKFPERYMVFPLDAAGTNDNFSLGFYNRTNKIMNGRPVWEHENRTQFLFFCLDNRWGLGPDYEKNLVYFYNTTSGVEIPATGWLRGPSIPWGHSSLGVLKVAHFPQRLMVFGNGPTTQERDFSRGNYKMVNMIFNEKPVWKVESGKNYLFFNSNKRSWSIGYVNMESNSSFISSEVPIGGFSVNFGDSWEKDLGAVDLSKIPQNLVIVGIHGHENPLLGLYGILPDVQNGKLAWKQLFGEGYLYYSCDHWCIGPLPEDCVFQSERVSEVSNILFVPWRTDGAGGRINIYDALVFPKRLAFVGNCHSHFSKKPYTRRFDLSKDGYPSWTQENQVSETNCCIYWNGWEWGLGANASLRLKDCGSFLLGAPWECGSLSYTLQDISNLPYQLTVSSVSKSKFFIGTYTLARDVKGNSVWGHENGKYKLFYHPDRYWGIFSNSNICYAYHPSASDAIPICGWFSTSCWSWVKDNSLSVVDLSIYATKFIVSKCGPQLSDDVTGTGLYRRMSNIVVNRKPVWVNEEGGLYLFRVDGDWVVGPDYGTNEYHLHNPSSSDDIPVNGWLSRIDKSAETKDIIIVSDVSKFPERILVSCSQPRARGLYSMVKTMSMNGMPVWERYEGGGVYFYYTSPGWVAGLLSTKEVLFSNNHPSDGFPYTGWRSFIDKEDVIAIVDVTTSPLRLEIGKHSYRMSQDGIVKPFWVNVDGADSIFYHTSQSGEENWVIGEEKTVAQNVRLWAFHFCFPGTTLARGANFLESMLFFLRFDGYMTQNFMGYF